MMGEASDDKDIFPDTPKFTEAELQRCRESGDYKPMMFEWYKFVGALCITVVNIIPTSPAFKQIPAQHYNVLIGLLNRCARLMISNVALSCERKFGETTVIIDRCIFESAVKLSWLCKQDSHAEFIKFLSEGLKTEVELKDTIDKNVAAHNGVPTKLEARMLRSIDRHFAEAGITYQEASGSKKLRDLSAMLRDLGQDRLTYVVGQKIGSHHVHGTWSSFLIHYIEKSGSPDYPFRPTSKDFDTHINQFMATPLLVLETLKAYVRYVIQGSEVELLCKFFSETWDEIWRIYTAAGEDAA